MPRFTPECFSFVANVDTANMKKFRAGIDQLLKEGVAQSFEVHNSLERVPLIGAVGPLQFEVLQYRLETEYKAECRVEPAPWKTVRWVRVKDGEAVTDSPPEVQLPSGCSLARDVAGQWVVPVRGYLHGAVPDRAKRASRSARPSLSVTPCGTIFRVARR